MLKKMLIKKFFLMVVNRVLPYYIEVVYIYTIKTLQGTSGQLFFKEKEIQGTLPNSLST
jgi:hypothetical protein